MFKTILIVYLVVLLSGCKHNERDVAVQLPAMVSKEDGQILSQQTITFEDEELKQKLNEIFPDLLNQIKDVKFSKIIYVSDGLRVIAYVAEPKKAGKYPCIISNRGGNRSFGQWNPITINYLLGTMAHWGYVVVATQYRGNDGGEGVEDFGGADVNDALNLVRVLKQIPNADSMRIGIEGTSRGGMTTYLALKKTCLFKAAAVTAAPTNLFEAVENRPEMKKICEELIPNYEQNREVALKERSAIYWADQICKTTPLLILQGSADKRVDAQEAITLLAKLQQQKHPTRFLLFEGADHIINEYREEHMEAMKKHFDYYLRDGKPLPNMEPHGK